MRVQKRNPLRTGLGVAVAVITLLTVGPAGAQMAPPDDLGSDQAGSVVVFPKVIADGTRDTLITLTNTKNIQAFVHCQYIPGSGVCEQLSPSGARIPCSPIDEVGTSPDCTTTVGERCIVDWRPRDFDLLLTRQQPTIWRVSTGRVFNALQDAQPGTECTNAVEGNPPNTVQHCPGFLFTTGSPDDLNPVGNLPPPPGGGLFRGELKCYQTDGFRFPGGETPDPPGNICGNALKGEAIIGFDPSHPITGPEISKYNSINFKGGGDCDGDETLSLNGVEYSACPEALEFTHFANLASNDVVENVSPAACDSTGCPVRTEITLVPCTELLEGDVGERVPLHIEFIDEFEINRGSAFPFLECWANYDLSDLTNVTAASSMSSFWKTKIEPTGRRCRTGTNLSDPLCNRVPTRPGECHNRACNNDADCGTGGLCAPASGIIGIVEQFYYTDSTISVSADPTMLQFLTGNPPGVAAVSETFRDNNGDGDVFRRGRCRGALTTPCDVDGDCTTAPNECVTDVILTNDIPGTEGPIRCDTAAQCPQTPPHSCQGAVQGQPLSGVCVPS